MNDLDRYRQMAKTLDVASATVFLKNRLPLAPRNSLGAQVSQADWVLSGLHYIRATDPSTAAADVTASKKWLADNGWDVPA